MIRLRTDRDVPVAIAGGVLYCGVYEEWRHMMKKTAKGYTCPKRYDNNCGRLTVDEFVEAIVNGLDDFLFEVEDEFSFEEAA